MPLAAFLEYEDVRDAHDAVAKLDGFRGWVSVLCGSGWHMSSNPRPHCPSVWTTLKQEMSGFNRLLV